MKVLKFRDGADVFVVPEGDVESISSFSPDGAVLTLKSGQEVTVDRNAGVDAVEVDSIEEMVRMVVARKTTKCTRSNKRVVDRPQGVLVQSASEVKQCSLK